MAKTIFKPFRGTEEQIAKQDKIDGSFYIAKDTGHVYMDIGSGLDSERIQLNGSGVNIYYSCQDDDLTLENNYYVLDKKYIYVTDEEHEAIINASIEDFDYILQINDLILNINNNTFYKIESMNGNNIYVSPIMVSGTGQGGGEGSGSGGSNLYKLEAIKRIPYLFEGIDIEEEYEIKLKQEDPNNFYTFDFTVVIVNDKNVLLKELPVYSQSYANPIVKINTRNYPVGINNKIIIKVSINGNEQMINASFNYSYFPIALQNNNDVKNFVQTNDANFTINFNCLQFQNLLSKYANICLHIELDDKEIIRSYINASGDIDRNNTDNINATIVSIEKDRKQEVTGKIEFQIVKNDYQLLNDKIYQLKWYFTFDIKYINTTIAITSVKTNELSQPLCWLTGKNPILIFDNENIDTTNFIDILNLKYYIFYPQQYAGEKETIQFKHNGNVVNIRYDVILNGVGIKKYVGTDSSQKEIFQIEDIWPVTDLLIVGRNSFSIIFHKIERVKDIIIQKLAFEDEREHEKETILFSAKNRLELTKKDNEYAVNGLIKTSCPKINFSKVLWGSSGWGLDSNNDLTKYIPSFLKLTNKSKITFNDTILENKGYASWVLDFKFKMYDIINYNALSSQIEFLYYIKNSTLKQIDETKTGPNNMEEYPFLYLFDNDKYIFINKTERSISGENLQAQWKNLRDLYGASNTSLFYYGSEEYKINRTEISIDNNLSLVYIKPDTDFELKNSVGFANIEEKNATILFKAFNSQNETLGGIAIGAQEAAVFESENITKTFVRFDENKLINLTFAYISQDISFDNKNILYIYINGLYAAAVEMEDNNVLSQFINSNNTISMEINSNNNAINLYSIKLFNGSDFNLKEALNNYYFNMHYFEDRELMNNLLTSSTSCQYILDYQKIKDYKNIIMPYAVWTMKTDQEKLPYYKSNSGEIVDIEFVNAPADEEAKTYQKKDLSSWLKYYQNSPSYIAEDVNINVQGTSSQKYPRRNFKTKFKDAKTWTYTQGPLYGLSVKGEHKFFIKNNNLYVYSCIKEKRDGEVKAQKHYEKIIKSIDAYETNITPIESNETEYDNITNEKLYFLSTKFHMDNPNYGTNKFTWKIDYMESSGKFNTGFANLVSNIYNHHPLYYYNTTKDDYTYRTSVYGYPVLVFQKYNTSTNNQEQSISSNDYKYIGKYNMNLDKSSNEYYGFEEKNSSAECWELKDNQGDWCSFRYPEEESFTTTSTKNYIAPLDHFEIRYTANEDFENLMDGENIESLNTKEKKEHFAYQQMNNLETVFNWLNSTDTMASFENPQELISSVTDSRELTDEEKQIIQKYKNNNSLTYEDQSDYSLATNFSTLEKYYIDDDNNNEKKQIFLKCPLYYKAINSNEISEDVDYYIITNTESVSNSNVDNPLEEMLYIKENKNSPFIISTDITPISGTTYYQIKEVNPIKLIKVEIEDSSETLETDSNIYYTYNDIGQLIKVNSTDDSSKNYYIIDNNPTLELEAFFIYRKSEINNQEDWLCSESDSNKNKYFEWDSNNSKWKIKNGEDKIYILKTNVYNITYYKDNPFYRLYKFKNEFEKYFNMDYCLIYFIMTELMMCYDSRGKNMMLGSWGPIGNNYVPVNNQEVNNWIQSGGKLSDKYFIKDINAKEITQCDDDSTYPNDIIYYKKPYVWFPMFYDIDTQQGLNNSGLFLWDYDTDVTEDNVFSTSRSVLWNNFYSVFKNQIIEKYRALRRDNKITAEKIISTFNLIELNNDRQVRTSMSGKRPDIIYALDMYYKYFQIANKGSFYNTNGIAVQDNTQLTLCQGTRSQSIARFVYNRINYLDSLYIAGNYTSEVATGQLTLRVNNVKFTTSSLNASPNYNLQPISKQYFTFFIDTNYQNILKYDPKESNTLISALDKNLTAYKEGVSRAIHQQLNYIPALDYLVDLGDLSYLYFDYITMPTPQSSSFKFKELLLGNNLSSYKNKEMSINPSAMSLNLEYHKVLQRLQLDNIENLTSQHINNGNLSNQESLEYFSALGTKITTLTFADGAPLKLVLLPETIQSLIFKNIKGNNLKIGPIDQSNLQPVSKIYGINKIKENSNIAGEGDWARIHQYYKEKSGQEGVYFESTTNLEFLTVEGNAFGSYLWEFINRINNYRKNNSQAPQFIKLDLKDINWNMTEQDFNIFFNNKYYNNSSKTAMNIQVNKTISGIINIKNLTGNRDDLLYENPILDAFPDLILKPTDFDELDNSNYILIQGKEEEESENIFFEFFVNKNNLETQIKNKISNKLIIPFRENHDFKGWQTTDKSFKIIYDETKLENSYTTEGELTIGNSNKSITLIPVFEEHKYNIIFYDFDDERFTGFAFNTRILWKTEISAGMHPNLDIDNEKIWPPEQPYKLRPEEYPYRIGQNGGKNLDGSLLSDDPPSSSSDDFSYGDSSKYFKFIGYSTKTPDNINDLEKDIEFKSFNDFKNYNFTQDLILYPIFESIESELNPLSSEELEKYFYIVKSYDAQLHQNYCRLYFKGAYNTCPSSYPDTWSDNDQKIDKENYLTKNISALSGKIKIPYAYQEGNGETAQNYKIISIGFWKHSEANGNVLVNRRTAIKRVSHIFFDTYNKQFAIEILDNQLFWCSILQYIQIPKSLQIISANQLFLMPYLTEIDLSNISYIDQQIYNKWFFSSQLFITIDNKITDDLLPIIQYLAKALDNLIVKNENGKYSYYSSEELMNIIKRVSRKQDQLHIFYNLKNIKTQSQQPDSLDNVSSLKNLSYLGSSSFNVTYPVNYYNLFTKPYSINETTYDLFNFPSYRKIIPNNQTQNPFPYDNYSNKPVIIVINIDPFAENNNIPTYYFNLINLNSLPNNSYILFWHGRTQGNNNSYDISMPNKSFNSFQHELEEISGDFDKNIQYIDISSQQYLRWPTDFYYWDVSKEKYSPCSANTTFDNNINIYFQCNNKYIQWTNETIKKINSINDKVVINDQQQQFIKIKTNYINSRQYYTQYGFSDLSMDKNLYIGYYNQQINSQFINKFLFHLETVNSLSVNDTLKEGLKDILKANIKKEYNLSDISEQELGEFIIEKIPYINSNQNEGV